LAVAEERLLFSLHSYTWGTRLHQLIALDVYRRHLAELLVRLGRGALEFSLRDKDPAHATVQGAYALYLIKYRYPQWIDQDFK
jgi:hypothetical protein